MVLYSSISVCFFTAIVTVFSLEGTTLTRYIDEINVHIDKLENEKVTLGRKSKQEDQKCQRKLQPYEQERSESESKLKRTLLKLDSLIKTVILKQAEENRLLRQLEKKQRNLKHSNYLPPGLIRHIEVLAPRYRPKSEQYRLLLLENEYNHLKLVAKRLQNENGAVKYKLSSDATICEARVNDEDTAIQKYLAQHEESLKDVDAVQKELDDIEMYIKEYKGQLNI